MNNNINYLGTVKVKANTKWIYAGLTLKIRDIKSYKRHIDTGRGRQFEVSLLDTEFPKTHGYTYTVLPERDLEEINIIEQPNKEDNDIEMLALELFPIEMDDYDGKFEEYDANENARNSFKIWYETSAIKANTVNKELLEAAEKVSTILDFVINATETGTNRIHLTDANIWIKSAIEKTKTIIN